MQFFIKIFCFQIVAIQCQPLLLNSRQFPERLREKILAENPIIPNRLLQPFLNESIAHILMNSLDEIIPGPMERMDLDSISKEMAEEAGLTELVSICADPREFEDLPQLFPRFLCGLVSIFREFGKAVLPFSGNIFARPTNAIQFLNDVRNYPCHSMNLTDAVAMVPGRIYSGCVNDTDPYDFTHFDSAFVMTHPFPDVKDCSENIKKCELRSMMIQHTVVYQQKDCCCQTHACAILVFSQTHSLTPIIMKTIDLTQEAKLKKRRPTTKAPRAPKRTRSSRGNWNSTSPGYTETSTGHPVNISSTDSTIPTSTSMNSTETSTENTVSSTGPTVSSTEKITSSTVTTISISTSTT